MRIIDVDSHFYEPLGWLDEHFPKLANQLPPLSVGEFIFRFGTSDVLDAIPPDKRLADPMDLAPQIGEYLKSLPPIEKLDDLLGRDRAVCHPEDRLRRCDEQGIDVQFINNNWAHMPYMKAREIGRNDLASQVLEAYNTWASDLLHGYTDRLIPITFLELEDVGRAVEELRRMREAGSRAFTLKPAPVSRDRSLTHPDHEVLCSTSEELGMLVIFHVGPSGPAPLDPGWLANGGNPSTFNLLNMVQAPSAKLALAAMVFDGVFERHPKLVVIIEELGISWLPEFLERMDTLAKGRGRAPYDLPLLPSDYITRQVRVAALATTDALYPTLDRVSPELVVYSTDYPHPEGGKTPFETFSEQLSKATSDVREDFFGGSIARLVDL
ncbi:MAG: amidohydrolase family protein [Myxococcota bacterium]